MSGKGFIAVEDNDFCQLCGKYDELRPYGPSGQRICFDCGQKDEKTAKRKMQAHIFGEYEA